ncbi:MAG: hypothetical protein H8E20_10200 [Verrucomicrobia bacterium]|nr:hypothetical protein [Verrucomicrobiota bacterium]
MGTSKRKSKKEKNPEPEFADLALKAMIKAQKTAARENARYGLKLIVEESR